MSATAVIIGNFDGVHLGHAALVAAARGAVSSPGSGGRVVVMTFDPHPATVLRPGQSMHRLSTFEQRVEWLVSLGTDAVVRLEPTKELLGQSAEEFVQWVVEHSKLQGGVWVEGSDFRFGRERAGSVQTLRDLEAKHGYRTIVVDEVEASLMDQSVVKVSSTMIRWLLQRGRVGDAARLLGREYEIAATVVKGDQRGRELGFPTANLDHGDFLLPADGIYAGSATLPDGKRYAAAISVGTKPTFGGHARVCEAHLPGFDGKLNEYGWKIRLRFERWMRDQLRYEAVQPLVEQLKRDVECVGGM